MIKAQVNGQTEFAIEHDELSDSYTVNDKTIVIDAARLSENSFHILKNYQSYNVEILAADYSTKSFTIKVNSSTHTVQLKDRYDELLHQLGFDKVPVKKANDIKAPMPGLVKDILVSEGQQLQAGDSVIVLEAMKMENILKAPADAVVKSIIVRKGSTVEKNEVIITFV